MKKRVIANLFLVILFASIISATFNLGDPTHLIENSYYPGDNIKGWINISLTDVPADSLFTDSENNSIRLIDLLQQNENLANTTLEYNCSTSTCLPDYSLVEGGELNKTFDLNLEESKIIGFKFSGELTKINLIKFTLQSDAPEWCFNQLEIDFLNDGVIDWRNSETSENVCSILKNYGCFDSSKTTGESIISSTNKYCQRITLSESPGFRLGAWVNPNNDNRDIQMELQDLNRNYISNCKLNLGSEAGEYSCEINYEVTKAKEFYVCIYSSSEASGDERIKGYEDLDNACAYFGSNEERSAFQIFATGRKFQPIGTMVDIQTSPILGLDLSYLAENYIQEKYGDLDCSTKECIVPIKFISGKDQELNLTDLEIEYYTTSAETEDTIFYDLEESPVTINSDLQQLYLNPGNFSLQWNPGSISYKFKLNNTEIFSEDIFIKTVPLAIISINPTKTASAFPTTFEVEVQSQSNITQYKWDFGEGTNKTTLENKIQHTYAEVGLYPLTITVTDSNQQSSSKTFNIDVVSPKEIINTTLKKMQTNLANVNSQVEKFSSFSQTNINSIVKLDELDENLKNLQQTYLTASSTEEYNEIMTLLLGLKIPESITESDGVNSATFFPNKDNVQPNILQLIGGGDYDSSQKNQYTNAIFAWNQENLETKITFKEFSITYEKVEEPLLKIFELKITDNGGLSETPYLIIQKLSNLKFKENYNEKEESGYVYIDLTQEKTVIDFSTTENIEFTELPLFISPRIDSLPTQGILIQEEDTTSKWIFFGLIIFLLILIGIIVYIVLQTWYKKKYENYLFKNKNELFNMITYVHNSQKKNLDDKTIAIKLKKVGWGSEQIAYVMKKYAGKRTGMAEIHVEKILDKFKKKNAPAQIPPRQRNLKLQKPVKKTFFRK